MLVNRMGGGGTERNVAMFCRFADRARFEPEVWTLLAGGDLEPAVGQAGVPIRCLNRRRAWDPAFALWASRQIAHAEVDLIHVFLPAIAFNVALAKAIWRVPTPVIYSEPSSRPSVRLKNVLRRWGLRRFSSFCANSPASRRYLVDSGVDPDRIHLIPNGHDLSLYGASPERRAAVRQPLALDADAILAVFVGRLIPSKRVGDLLEAIPLVHRVEPRLRVAIVGDGPEREVLGQHVQSLGLEPVVRFLGRRSDVPELLGASDLFVFPSEAEGLPNAVIEAALTGLPIVAGDIPGVREIVLGGGGAFLTPCRDPQALAAAITRVLAQPEEAKQRARLSQQFAETEYAIERVTQRLYNVYEEILHAERTGS
jgi:glycosyltransferase involved in cell wall biosynthesis